MFKAKRKRSVSVMKSIFKMGSKMFEGMFSYLGDFSDRQHIRSEFGSVARSFYKYAQKANVQLVLLLTPPDRPTYNLVNSNGTLSTEHSGYLIAQRNTTLAAMLKPVFVTVGTIVVAGAKLDLDENKVLVVATNNTNVSVLKLEYRNRIDSCNTEESLYLYTLPVKKLKETWLW